MEKIESVIGTAEKVQHMTTEVEIVKEVIKESATTPSVRIRYTMNEANVADRVEESLKTFFFLIQNNEAMAALEKHLQILYERKDLKFAQSRKLFGGAVVIGSSDPQSVLSIDPKTDPKGRPTQVVEILKGIAFVDGTGLRRTITLKVKKLGRSVLASTTMGGVRQTEEQICLSDKHPDAGSLANVAHEMCHVVDFYHKGNFNTPNNAKYVPYAVGNWFGSLQQGTFGIV